jgi:PTS system nitrogen regulatory IIA component
MSVATTGPTRAGRLAPTLRPGSRANNRDSVGGLSMEGRMKLSDFVVNEAILVDLQATGKEDAIREIVRSLSQAGRLSEADLEGVSRAILGREELGSTGIGQGVAVPHTRHPTVNRLIGTVALSRHGVDFAALDGEPVDIFFLLISPPNQPGDHLRALENISRHLKDERFVSFLRQAKTRENVIELLDEADQGAH